MANITWSELGKQNIQGKKVYSKLDYWRGGREMSLRDYYARESMQPWLESKEGARER